MRAIDLHLSNEKARALARLFDFVFDDDLHFPSGDMRELVDLRRILTAKLATTKPRGGRR
jgi:hypothetical protein